MRWERWLAAIAVTAFAFGTLALAQEGEEHGLGHGHGHGHDKDHYHSYDRDDHDHDFYHNEHRYAMRDWYEDHRDHLPPGLRDRDRMPPGLEKQLLTRGTLPPGLQKKFYPCPEDLERQLPPPPPNCVHVLVGGHVILLNRVNFQIMDVFHFEM